MARIDFFTEAREIADELVSIRRDLHQHPEVGLDLPRTQEVVLQALAELGLSVHRGTELSSVVAVLKGALPGPTVLLRGDMDALPVNERNDLPYRSTNGAMHACGHDLHTSGLIGAARLLAAHRDTLQGSVVFMFQPGEEGLGGAKLMLEEGLLQASGEVPIAAFALHVMPGQSGIFTTKAGAAMSGSNQLYVTFRGRGGHGSMPHRALDPVRPAVEFVQALQSMVSSTFDVFDPVVAQVTQLSAGDAVNVIPETASIGATVRTLSDEATSTFGERATRLAQGIAAAHGCEADVTWNVAYPVTMNDAEEAQFVSDTLTSALPDGQFVPLANPMMASEDFSFVLREVPGAYYFLFASPPEIAAEDAAMNHSPLVQFDDAVLPEQAASLATVAFERLEQASARP